jgi:hypothetical protein
LAVYLVEDEVGFDPNLVGFPSLGGCMAFAVQLEDGLWGFHIPPGHKERVSAFKEHCGPFVGIRRLFGSCYWANRYAGAEHPFMAWLDEMRYLASVLGFSGPMTGFNTSAIQTNIALADATYLEYRRNAITNSCSIHYAKMDYVTATKTTQEGTAVRRLAANGTASVPFKSRVVTAVAHNVGSHPMIEVTRHFGLYSVA